MTDLITAEAAKKLMDGTTPGPWAADGDPWNRIIWSSAENRVCFMAHSNGLNDDQDMATSRLVAAAPDLARTVIALHAQLADAQAAQAMVGDRAVEGADFAKRRLESIADESWNGDARDFKRRIPGVFAELDAIRSLADPTGVALLAELRAERDAALQAETEYRRKSHALTDERDRLAAANAVLAAGQQALAQIKGPLQVIDSPELHTLRAERDRLAAANAVLEAKVAGLVEAAEDAEYDLLQWLECSKALTAAGFNMDGTAEVTAKLTAALSHIKRGKTNG